jgi:hypothetical protein
MATSNSMAFARFGHTATLLNNGQVLMAGTILPFVNQSCGTLSCATTELYDPTSNSFTVAGPLNNARYNHTAVRLLSGEVLATGECCMIGQTALTASETVNQNAEVWTTQASLTQARARQTAVLLSDGRMFIAGGTTASVQTEYYLDDAPLFDFPSFNLPLPYGNSSTVVMGLREANQLPIAEGSGGYKQFNLLTTAVRICVPGTTTCQALKGVQIDSGSDGFRVFSSQLGGVSLPNVIASDGGTVGDCEQYVSSAVRGAVAMADVHVGNEPVITMPIQVMDDTNSFVAAPSSCTDGSALTNTPASFGANGLIGIDVSPTDGGLYYSCPAAIATRLRRRPGR